jgi:catalase
VDGNGGSSQNYHPNSFDGVTETPSSERPPYLGVAAVDRYNHRLDGDYYSQAGDLYRLMSADQKKLLTDNIIGAMKTVPESIQRRQIEHFLKADQAYGQTIKKGLGL